MRSMMVPWKFPNRCSSLLATTEKYSSHGSAVVPQLTMRVRDVELMPKLPASTLSLATPVVVDVVTARPS